MNYAKWQLLYNEYKIFGAFLNNGIQKVRFSATDAVDLACAHTVEMLMPLAVARPFVEEFITPEVIDQVRSPHEYSYVFYDNGFIGQQNYK